MAGGDIETAAGSGITSAGAANALGGGATIAHAALQDIALSGMNAVHTTKTVTPTANTNVSNLGGSPPINRTAYGQMGTSPTTEGAPSSGRSGATFHDDPHSPATCGPTGNVPRCGTNAALSPALQRLVLEFLNTPSPELSLNGMTVAESTVNPLGSGEHAAAIIQKANGDLRLGEVSYTSSSGGKYDPEIVHLNSPELGKGERFVGAIHTHPGARVTALTQSRGFDLPAARAFAGQNPAFQSLVVGQSGVGPYFGVVSFQPNPAPGTLTTFLPGP
jgi:hypothetical protein